MTPLIAHAAWTLAAAHTIAFAYELWRATAKAGTSRHDSMKVFVQQGLVTYAVAAGVIAALFAGFAWAAWLGLAFAVAKSTGCSTISSGCRASASPARR